VRVKEIIKEEQQESNLSHACHEIIIVTSRIGKDHIAIRPIKVKK
jgi:hypothetical protein